MLTLRPPRGGRRRPATGSLLFAVAAALAALGLGSLLRAVPAGAGESGLPDLGRFPPPRVVVVGDSILLGAAAPIDARFRFAGFNPVVDAAENRSTNAGADRIAEHLKVPADALVVFLGANDSADTARFEGLVNRILDSASGVKRVYWVTTPAVRDHYPAANQAVARVAARKRGEGKPNMTVLDWAAVTGADQSLTSGDGLHLKPHGADALASMITRSVVDDHTADSLAALAAWEKAHATTTTTTTTSVPAAKAKEAPSPTTAPARASEAAGERSDSDGAGEQASGEPGDGSGASDSSGIVMAGVALVLFVAASAAVAKRRAHKRQIGG